MSELNIETFNNILFRAFKDQSVESRIGLLEAELEMADSVFVNAVAEVLDELKENGYESDKFQKVINIKENMESLLEELMELKGGDSE